MSRVFKNVLCVATLLLAQSGAYGMEKTIDPAHEIGENVTITDRSQLLSITPEQAKKIKSLRIENQDIDDEFRDFFTSLNILDSLCFYRCDVGGSLYGVDIGCYMLKLTECSLTSKNASYVLSPIRAWPYLRILDLSVNNIGVEPEPFFEWIRTRFLGIASVDKLILSDNGFEASRIDSIMSDFKKWDRYLQITF